MRHIKLFEQFLNEDLFTSKVLGNVFYKNMKKTTKGGGPIRLAVKSNRKTTAEIIFSFYVDVPTKEILNTPSFDTEKYPHMGMVYFDAKWDNKKNGWKVNQATGTEIAQELGLEPLKKGFYTDDQFATILTKYFDAV